MGVIETNCQPQHFNISGIDYHLPDVECSNNPMTLHDYQENNHTTCCYPLTTVKEFQDTVIGNGLIPRFGFPHFLQINYITKSPSDTIVWDKNYRLIPSLSDHNIWISFSSIFKGPLDHTANFFSNLSDTYYNSPNFWLSFGLEYLDYSSNYQDNQHSGLSLIELYFFYCNYAKYLNWLDQYEPKLAKIIRENVVLSTDYKIQSYQDYITIVKYHHYFGFYIPTTNKIVLLANRDNLESLQNPHQYITFTAGLVHEIAHQQLESMQLSTTPSSVVLNEVFAHTNHLGFEPVNSIIERTINSDPENEWVAIAAEIDYLKSKQVPNEEIWEFAQPYLDYNILQYYKYLYPQLYEASSAYFHLACPALGISQTTCDDTFSYIKTRLDSLSLGMSFINKFSH